MTCFLFPFKNKNLSKIKSVIWSWYDFQFINPEDEKKNMFDGAEDNKLVFIKQKVIL